MSTLKNLFLRAAETKDPIEFKILARSIAARVGDRDANGVYFMKPEFQTKTSRAIKPASLDYPDNYFEHAQTRKYVEGYLTQLEIKFLSGNLNATGSLLKTAERRLKTLITGDKQ
ncbi:MAG: hypothetical protein QM527_07120 [Alphaproteobacteria bacterium]|jgi:hypothetical protein|nr:hypothetical protein [Alphaproteobacteria bacterium]